MTQESQESVENEAEIVLEEASRTFRQSLKSIDKWAKQVGEVIQKNPGVALAGVAVIGFFAGLTVKKLATDGSDSHPREEQP